MKCEHKTHTDVDEFVRCDGEYEYVIGVFLKGVNERRQLAHYCNFHTGKLLQELSHDPNSIRLLSMVSKT